MDDITFSVELKNQWRKPEAYLQQAENLFNGLCRLVIIWSILTASFTFVILALCFYAASPPEYSQKSIYDAFHIVFPSIAFVMAFLSILSNHGQFRNVFHKRANEKTKCNDVVKMDSRSQIETTEQLLVQYGLITEEDILIRYEGLEKSGSFEKANTLT